MNLGEFVILVSFLVFLLFVPIVIVQMIGRRHPKPNLRECPDCGAENRLGTEQCYCCGHHFGLSPVQSLEIIQLVQRADDSKARRSVETQAGQHSALENTQEQ